MITALDHIAIAVPDMRKAIKRFMEDFELGLEATEDIAAEATRVAFFNLKGTRIELIHPLNDKSPVARYLEKQGGGLHHICFRSDNIEADVARLKAKGYQFVNDFPTTGADNSKIAFIHPRSCDGVLVELKQPATEK